MPLSTQGQEVLGVIYDSYRQYFIRANLGCNENDVERSFLRHCQINLVAPELQSEFDEMIEEIR